MDELYESFLEFYRKMLNNFNFPINLKDLFMSCLKNVIYTPHINGEKGESFSPSKGIRQGDPISPYIFILGMELITLLIDQEISSKNWTPFKFKNKNPHISTYYLHLTFFYLQKQTQKARKQSIT